MSTAWKLANDDRKRIREARPVTDVSTIVKGAGKKAATIYSTYVSSVKKARENQLVPAEGREQLMSEARDKADLRELEQRVEAAAHVEKARLSRRRHAARPKIDSATADRYARQITRMVDAGIGLETIIEEYRDNVVALRVLEDEIRPLARSLSPHDRDAGDGFESAVFEATLSAYSDEYRAAHESLQASEDAAYYADVGITQARDGIENPDSLPVVPGPKGEIVYNAANADAA